jgi:hypothetical protein
MSERRSFAYTGNTESNYAQAGSKFRAAFRRSSGTTCAKTEGIAVGERAAAAVLSLRADDGADAAESYRPHTTAGAYVPTVVPVATQWPHRKPWVMASADQFQPRPPQSLDSELWARDYNEIKAPRRQEPHAPDPGTNGHRAARIALDFVRQIRSGRR